MGADSAEQLPSAEEQWRAYQHAMETFRAAYDRWIADGRPGPPPPRPVRPHTPGYDSRRSKPTNPDLET